MRILLFCCAAMVVVFSTAVGYERISIFDESTHIDYVYRLSHGELVRRGDALSSPVLREWACRGFFDTRATDFPSCDQPDLDPSEFPASGINYNEFHPPGYYGLTAVASTVVLAISPVDDFVLAERLVGVAWLVAGMAFVFALCRELGCTEWRATCVALSVALLPAVIFQSSMVTNDAAALAAGGALMWVTMRAVAGRASVGLVAAVGLAVASLKVVFGITAIAAVLMLVGSSIAGTNERARRRRLLVSAGVLLGSFVVVQFGWAAVQDLRAPPGDYVNPVLGVTGRDAIGVPLASIASKATSLVAPSASAFVPAAAANPLLRLWQWVSSAMLALAPIVVSAMRVMRRRDRWFAASMVLSAALGGVVVATQYYVSWGQSMRYVNARYGLCLIPGYLSCVGLVVQRSHRARTVLAGVAAAGAVIVATSYVLIM